MSADGTRRTIYSRAVSVPVNVQRDQPDGVPPLALTGERTLPDVPAENYWFRRHLAVYEWVAARVAGLRVLDMACGEGYGSAVLAASATSVIGVDGNPDAHEQALRLGWDRMHRGLGVTERFYGWFVPAISVSDFALRAAGAAQLDRALDFLAVCGG